MTVVVPSVVHLEEASQGEKVMVVAQSGIHLEEVSQGEKVMVEAPSGILLVEETSDDLGRWANSHDLLPIKWCLGIHDQLGGGQGKCMKASETVHANCFTAATLQHEVILVSSELLFTGELRVRRPN